MLRTLIKVSSVLLIVNFFVFNLGACSTFTAREPSQGIEFDASVSGAQKSTLLAGRQRLFNPQQRSDFKEAVTLLEKATRSRSVSPSVWIDLGYAYSTQNRFNDSRLALANAMQHSESLSAAEVGWVDALSARIADNAEDEIKAWKALTKLQPKNRWVWYRLGAVLYRIQRYSEASNAFENALLIDSLDQAWQASHIHYLNAKSYYRAGKLEQSRIASLPGQRIKISERANFYRQAMAELALGHDKNIHAVIKKYRRLSDTRPSFDESVFLTNVANFFFELGDYSSAIEYASAAYDLKPGNYQTWALAYALTESGRALEAIKVLQNSPQKTPQKLHTLAVTGWAYYRLGQLTKAREFLLAAKATQARKHYGVERDLAIVELALANPNTPQVGSVRWFGD